MVWNVWLYNVMVVCLLARVVHGQGGDDGNEEYPASRGTGVNS